METLLYSYLAAINAIAFLAFVIDKGKAKRKQWRIPERVLLGLAAIGGAAGALLAMYTAHHKTRKPAFFVGVPVLLALQLGVLGYVLFTGM